MALVCFALCAFFCGFFRIGFVWVNDRVLLLRQTGEPRFEFREVCLHFCKFSFTVKRNTDALLSLFQISLQFCDSCLAVRDCLLDRDVKEVDDALPVVRVRCAADIDRITRA